jgi:hypothetical protein
MFQVLSIPTKHSLYASILILNFDLTGVNDLEQSHRTGIVVIEESDANLVSFGGDAQN